MKNNNMTITEWLGEENTLGQDIWKNKYQHNNETLNEWLDRISGGDNSLREIIEEKKFLFGGRILSNRGLHKEGKKVTYSNCYVIEPPKDNIESIFETASKLARTFSYGGGCGIDISKLAPRGAVVNNTAKETSGAVSFMSLYNLVTELIGQNGRRGALMLSIDCNHPDLEEFISVKNDLNSITKANISVRIDDEFMNAVIHNKEHLLTFTREETGETISKLINAKTVFEQLCYNNWDFAEPGILFWDRIKDHNLLSDDPEFEYAGVNPCAEEPLPAGGSCLLGSINLSEFVTPEGYFNYGEFERVVKISVRALNDLLDEGLPLHPLQEQKDTVGDWRQIGLGIFGLADMLIKMGLTYGSPESLRICDAIASMLIDRSLMTSSEIAKEKGAYPKYKKSALKHNRFLFETAGESTREHIMKYGLRNSQLLTIAPTGSLSSMLGVSGGIEPMYDTHYVRKTESLHDEDVFYNVYTPIVKKYMDEKNIEDVTTLPEYFTTAKKLNPMDRVLMQSVWQSKIDASISSTVNLHETATVEDVIDLYRAAWELGLKGLTIFRDNCARLGILSSVEEPKGEEINETIKMDDDIRDTDLGTRATIIECESGKIEPIFQLDSIKPITRDDLGDCLSGNTYVKHTACGKLYITINRDAAGNLVEVFIDPGKSGGCIANAESLGRYASACLRSGTSVEAIIDATKGIKCSACTKVKGMNKKIDGNSCGDIVARTIEEEYNKMNGKKTMVEYISNKKSESDIISRHFGLDLKEIDNKNICPDCGNVIAAQGGCGICLNCGYSKCQ